MDEEPLSKQIERAMGRAALFAISKGIDDPAQQRELMRVARMKTVEAYEQRQQRKNEA